MHHERCHLKTWKTALAIPAFALWFAAAASADTLELKDGRVLQGRFLGGTQAVMRFELNGEVRTFSINDIVALTFSTTYHDQNAAPPPPPNNQSQDAPAPPPPNGQDNGGAPPADNPPPPPDAQSSNAPPPGDSPTPSAPPRNTQPDVPPVPRDAPPPPPANSHGQLAQLAPGAPISVPVGQTLLVRMIDGVDSRKNNVGDIFHASLETDLTVNGYLVAHKGADVYGKLAYAKDSGHFSGGAELELELTKIVVDGNSYPLVSDDYTLKGKGRGGDTAKKVGGGAILGAIIGGIAGGGTGAAIGAGAGGAVGAGVQVFTRGKEVKVPSETLLEFKLQQPATVNATNR
ncbi:MAG TPA: hypothetical protein VE545_07830 [Candidatus Dormibacteraeota bacterium]|nr:hypothetical protein [Candidatus Dormibacteraeota bacterium]